MTPMREKRNPSFASADAEADVAQQRHGAADAECIAVDRGDGRLRHLLHQRREFLDTPRPIRAARGRPAAAADLPGEEVHVGAGAEGASGAGQDDGAHVAVAIGGPEGVGHLAPHDGCPGVQLLGPVECDDGDAVLVVDADGLEAHQLLNSSPLAVLSRITWSSFSGPPLPTISWNWERKLATRLTCSMITSMTFHSPFVCRKR